MAQEEQSHGAADQAKQTDSLMIARHVDMQSVRSRLTDMVVERKTVLVQRLVRRR